MKIIKLILKPFIKLFSSVVNLIIGSVILIIVGYCCWRIFIPAMHDNVKADNDVRQFFDENKNQAVKDKVNKILDTNPDNYEDTKNDINKDLNKAKDDMTNKIENAKDQVKDDFNTVKNFFDIK